MLANKKKILQMLIAILALQNFKVHITEAKYFAMRPLNAGQVYRLLHETGRMDAVPQGRVITQGLAAMTGFALGLTKGLGSAFLFDIITANVTAADLESAVNGGSNSNGAMTTQEICFNSRNARSLEEAEAIAEAYSRASDKPKKEKRKVRLSEVERRTKRKRRNKRGKKSKKKAKRKRPTKLILGKQSIGTVTAVDGGGDNAATAATTNPQVVATAGTVTVDASPTAAATGDVTNVNNGQGTGTTSSSTTETNNGGAVNCVVIQKPANS